MKNVSCVLKDVVVGLGIICVSFTYAEVFPETIYDAVENGNVALIRGFFENDSHHINKRGRWGRTLLHRAAYLGRLEVVRLLLEYKDIKINKKTDCAGWTALHIAASEGYEEIVGLLLEHKDSTGKFDLNVDQKTDSGRTALSVTLVRAPKIIQLLIDRGADPSVIVCPLVAAR
jgi:uncharacterized protein